MSQILQTQNLILLTETGVIEEDILMYKRACCLIEQSLEV